MNPRELLADAAQRLAAAGVENPRLDARLLLAHVLGVASAELFATSAEPSDANIAKFESVLARRIAREPLAYITGHKEFWSLDVLVGPGVLVPRPESETLIEQALKHTPDKSAALSILDLGIGSGCILIAALTEFANARGRGLESSLDAFEWAKRNIAVHKLAGRANLDLRDWNLEPDGAYDLIFSNPPYIESAAIPFLMPEVARHEPQAALDGGPDGLDAYRALAPQLARLLKPDGTAFIELGVGQGAMVAELFAEQGLEILQIVPDLAGIARCMIARRNPSEPSELPEKTVG